MARLLQYSPRPIANGLRTLSTKRLKDIGYFDYNYNYGDIDWYRGNEKYSIQLFAYITSTLPFWQSMPLIVIHYPVKSADSTIQYKDCIVLLKTTPCHFGRVRYWFMCPTSQCGRPVTKLYFYKGIFACRHCHNLWYESQRVNKKFIRIYYEWKLQDKIEKLWKKIKRPYYKGRKTKKYKKYEQMISS